MSNRKRSRSAIQAAKAREAELAASSSQATDPVAEQETDPVAEQEITEQEITEPASDEAITEQEADPVAEQEVAEQETDPVTEQEITDEPASEEVESEEDESEEEPEKPKRKEDKRVLRLCPKFKDFKRSQSNMLYRWYLAIEDGMTVSEFEKRYLEIRKKPGSFKGVLTNFQRRGAIRIE